MDEADDPDFISPPYDENEMATPTSGESTGNNLPISMY
jgi:hypothetical protein